MLVMYIKFCILLCVGVAIHQEVVTNGTFVNRSIRHYFGGRFLVEYSKEATLPGEIMEMPVDD